MRRRWRGRWRRVGAEQEIRDRLRQESLLQNALLGLTTLSTTKWSIPLGPAWYHAAPSEVTRQASIDISRDLQKALHRLRRGEA